MKIEIIADSPNDDKTAAQLTAICNYMLQNQLEEIAKDVLEEKSFYNEEYLK